MSCRAAVKPMPRGEPSGLPFHAKFIDVASEAGLRMPVIYGEVDHKDYILETVGSGAAFFDYDNDGWIDIFLLSGTRRKNAPKGAINRLYRNNRDGTFRDVTSDSGLGRSGWASSVTVGDYDNDGDEDLFVTNWGGTPFTGMKAKANSAMSRKMPAYCTRVTAGGRGARSLTTTGTATSTCLSPTIWSSTSRRHRARERE